MGMQRSLRNLYNQNHPNLTISHPPWRCTENSFLCRRSSSVIENWKGNNSGKLSKSEKGSSSAGCASRAQANNHASTSLYSIASLETSALYSFLPRSDKISQSSKEAMTRSAARLSEPKCPKSPANRFLTNWRVTLSCTRDICPIKVVHCLKNG